MKRARKVFSCFLCILMILTQLISTAYALGEGGPKVEGLVQVETEGEIRINDTEESDEGASSETGNLSESEEPGMLSEYGEPRKTDEALGIDEEPGELSEDEGVGGPKEGKESADDSEVPVRQEELRAGEELGNGDPEVSKEGEEPGGNEEPKVFETITYSPVFREVKAHSWEGEGTKDSPYKINSAEDMAKLSTSVNEGCAEIGKDTYFKLAKDISMPGNWTPIGTDINPFKGVFDGGGNTLKDLIIGGGKKSYQGLFGYNTGHIKNLTVSGSVYDAGDYVGGIVGFNAGNLENLTVVGRVYDSGNYVGGIVGFNTGNLKNLTVTGSVYGTGNLGRIVGKNYVGGIVGYNTGDLENLTVTGSVYGANDVGGIVGKNEDANLKNVKVIGGIYGTEQRVGGIVGLITGKPSDLTVTGSVYGSVHSEGDQVGGIAGSATGIEFKNFINAATVSGNNDVGGVAGKSRDSKFLNCVNNSTVTGKDHIGGIVGSDDGGTFGKCINQKDVTGTGKNIGGIVGLANDGSKLTDCYNEGNVRGSKSTGGVIGGSSGYVKLTDCYNAGTVEGEKDTGGVVGTLGKGSEPINCYNAEKGSVISTGTGYTDYTGGVIGVLKPVTTQIKGLYNAGTVHGAGYYTGGVIGCVDASRDGSSKDYITQCYNDITGKVTGSGNYVGGVVGHLKAYHHPRRGTHVNHIYRCYNLGSVGDDDVKKAAGISGVNYEGFAYVLDCFNYGEVHASEKVAAISIVGYEHNENCYYRENSVKGVPVDAGSSQCKTKEDFAGGEVAYLLDEGYKDYRTEHWGQGEDHPVPTDNEHPAVYKVTIQVEGPGEGFTTAVANSVNLDGKVAKPESPITAYKSKGEVVMPNFKLKEGYLLDRIMVTTIKGKDVAATVDDENMTFTFTMSMNEDLVVRVIFDELPANPDMEFTVTFNANGGHWDDGLTEKTVKVSAGKRVAAPSTPIYTSDTNTDFIFTGWYIDADCTKLYNFTAVVKENMTLYAGWKQVKKCTVIFDATDGRFTEGDELVVIVNSGDLVARPEEPIREGFNFLGWFVDKKYLILFDFKEPVFADIRLYAGWVEEGTCAVLFDANGGYFEAENGTRAEVIKMTVEEGELIEAPIPPKREKQGSTTYIFSEWLTDDNQAWNFDDPVNKSMILMADWKTNPFAELVDGAYEIPDLSVLEALRDLVNSGEGFADTVFRLTADISLPAHWTSIGYQESESFKGTFDGNGHIITLHPSQRESLFGFLGSSGSIENLRIEGNVRSISAGIVFNCSGTIKNCTVSAKLYDCSGGIANWSVGGTFINCTIESGSVIEGGTVVAGIVGVSSTDETKIKGCVVESGVTIRDNGKPYIYNQFASGVAGIVAYAKGTMENCINEACIYSPNDVDGVGGIVGSTNSVGNKAIEIIKCINIGNIYANGGDVGGIAGGTADYGYPITIEHCYSIGEIQATGGNVGGLLGSSRRGSKVENSYWYGKFKGIIGNGIVGKSEDDKVIDSYYHNGAETVEDEVKYIDPFDGKGANGLAKSAFPSGEAAYWLDGGEGTHANFWTQGVKEGYPIYGKPSYYKITLTSEGPGEVTIGEVHDVAYQGNGHKVELTAIPEEYTENEPYGPQYAYVLKSIVVTDANGKNIKIKDANGNEIIPVVDDDGNEIIRYPQDLIFDMPDSNVEVQAVFELVEVGVKQPPQEEEEDPILPEPGEGGGSGGSGGGSGTGGSGGGSGSGRGSGTGDGSGKGKGEGKGTGSVDDREDEDAVPVASDEEDSGVREEDVIATEPPTAPVKDLETPMPIVPISKVADPEPSEVDAIVSEPNPPEDGGGSDAAPKASGEIVESENKEEEEEEIVNLTVFEIVKKVVEDNPIITAVIVLLMVSIAAFGAFSRYRKYKQSK